MTKGKKHAIFVMVGVLLASMCAGLACAEPKPSVLWQERELVVEDITKDMQAVTAVCEGPYPAEGALVLVQLTMADGDTITEAELDAHAGAFLLAADEDTQARPFAWALYAQGEPYTLGIVFYIRTPGVTMDALHLRVQPLDEMPEAIRGAVLGWQGRQLVVNGWTTDKAALASLGWPETGYLVRVAFSAQDGGAIPDDIIENYRHELQLTDGGAYRVVYREGWLPWSPEGTTSFSLLYAVEGEAVPPPAALTLTVARTPALWLHAGFRAEHSLPFAEYVPHSPAPRTVALVLENFSQYAAGSPYAMERPQAALDALAEPLQRVRDGLAEMFGDAITLTDDPALASVVVGIQVRYPLAGSYGTAGTVKAYNCVLTLTAYDAVTHAVLATLRAGDYFGDTITVSPGQSRVWKQVPMPGDAAQEDRAAFLDSLNAGW